MIERLKLPEHISARLSPNVEADELEQALGITFSEKPLKIYISPEEDDEFLRTLLLHLRMNEIVKIGGKIEGVYNPTYNLTILFSRSSMVAYHENTHGFVYQLNPDIRQTPQESPQPGEFESAIIRGCFDEGIAEYTAINTCLTMKQSLRQDAIDRHNNLLDTMRLNKDFSFLEVTVSIAEEAESPIYGSSIYSVGYHFSLGAMEELRKKELTTSQALELLIKNPPTKVDQLRNPIEFTQFLLSNQNI